MTYNIDIPDGLCIDLCYFNCQVLEQIAKQNEVIEIPQPIISLQLVLNVPAKKDEHHKRRRRSSTLSGASDGTKKVTFPDENNRLGDIKEDDDSEEDESGKCCRTLKLCW